MSSKIGNKGGSGKIGNKGGSGKIGNNVLGSKLQSKVHNLMAQKFTKENHYLLKLLRRDDYDDHGLCDSNGNVICFYVDYANLANMVVQEFIKKNQHLMNLLGREHELYRSDGDKLLFYGDIK